MLRKIADFCNMEIIYVGNFRKSLNIYESFRQKIENPSLFEGFLAFINELTTFKCATLNVIIVYANKEILLQKAKTRLT